MNFGSGEELLLCCETRRMKISQVMLEREKALFPEKDAVGQMERALVIMRAAVAQALTEARPSMGGFLGGEAILLECYRKDGRDLCGPLLAKALAYSMGILEVNASMGLIVAAPTAGSSGVLWGVLLAAEEELGLVEKDLLAGLFTAGAIGYLITRNATVSGADGGCQAEVGAAAAMTAAALTELLGGAPQQCLDAAATALSNLMGLVCDPVGGLVEVPCQKRNALGAADAILSAQIALAGVKNLIPFDETVEAMHQVGKCIPSQLRETALGGLAATKTASALGREK
jgi:L-serine dehydratase